MKIFLQQIQIKQAAQKEIPSNMVIQPYISNMPEILPEIEGSLGVS